jgi:hypothetical protein
MQKSYSGDEFGVVLEIIRNHRANALVSVNVEHMLTNWEIGGYLSAKIKHEGWGKSTIDNLVDYIHTRAPSERGYGRSNLYSMVAVYDEFTSPDFTALVARYGNRIVQPLAGQFEGKVIQPVTGQIADLPDLQPRAAQIIPMPDVLALTTFTNIVEILNRTRTAHERLFYIVYAFRERLKKMELRRCLVNDTYSSLLGGDKKNFSKALVQECRSQHCGVCAFAVNEPRDGGGVQAVDDSKGRFAGDI